LDRFSAQVVCTVTCDNNSDREGIPYGQLSLLVRRLCAGCRRTLSVRCKGEKLAAGWHRRSCGVHHFYFENIFVKRWGGKMSIVVPEGMQHITATWKDDNLWVENYDPKTNRCIFQEYSRGTVLEGKVVLKNCNPVRTTTAP